MYKIVNDGLRDRPNSCPYDGFKKRDLTVAMEEMQAKMEKIQDVNALKQQNEIFADYSKGLEPLQEFPNKPTVTSASPGSIRKKVFIRSRL